MEKKSSNWYFPADLICLLFLWIGIPAIAIFTCDIMSLLSSLTSADALRLFCSALGFAVVGTVLLFLARLPLYRQRKFWTVGPRDLDQPHHRLYWLAYLFVLTSIGLLVVGWFRVR
jgi:hypothetical protein